MDMEKAKFVLSNERMSMYERIAQRRYSDPLYLYRLNAEISASFHFPLEICEITLRNAVDRLLSATFTDDWHVNPQFQRIIGEYHRGKLLDSVKKNTDKTGVVLKSKVIADLSLGFWVKLLSPNYASIWKDLFYDCFANYKALNPSSVKPENALNALYNQLSKIKDFRNRIAHYEPIIHNNLQAEYNRILNVIHYIDADCACWVQENQQTTTCIKRLNEYLTI
jgi:hypothetical protein